MASITPSTIGELPEVLITDTRECLDNIMITTEKRTSDALMYLQRSLQDATKGDEAGHNAHIDIQMLYALAPTDSIRFLHIQRFDCGRPWSYSCQCTGTGT